MRYECFLCFQRFADENAAIKHLQKQHKIKEQTTELKCLLNFAYCGKSYITYSGLRKHLKTCSKQAFEHSLSIDVNIQDSKHIEAENENLVSNFEKMSVDGECPETIANDCEDGDEYELRLFHVDEYNDQENEPSFEYSDPDKSNTFLATKRMNSYLEKFSSEMNNMYLKQTDMDKIYELVGELSNELRMVNSSLIEDKNGMNALQVLDLTSTLVSSHFKKINSSYKRRKNIAANPFYVAPQEIGIGTRFELDRDRCEDIAIPQRIQSTFEYVSIVDTLKSLFERDEFRAVYFKHNSGNERGHKCVDNVYERFCCGAKYKNTDFLQTNNYRLQIQLATDDFEPCNPLQSKAGSHKICAVYFVIRNMPTEYLSRLKNIYLVCLCNSNDLKTKQTDFNNIWNLIVKDISYLENVGIDIEGKINIKGTLAYLSFDNLGGNSSLGFVESFQAFFYCRICELPKEKCQEYTKEDPEVLRSKSNYMERLATIETSEKVNYSQTKGVKRLCALNELNFFHVVENISVDILHDLNEGVIPFVLKQLFNRCIFLKLFTEKELVRMVRFYDFGFLNSKNRPSQIALEKSNLGQNGAQSKCLFLHLPFILFKYKNNPYFIDLWVCVKSLLRICQIASSYIIDSADLVVLETEVRVHLESIRKCFKVKLTPKHHLLTHYSRVIREMGPIVHMSMIRFESKHKFFKDCIRKSNNFININRSLALKHQEYICDQANSYKDEFSNGAKRLLAKDFDMHSMFNDLDRDILQEAKWFRFNGILFRKGLLIIDKSEIFEIVKILFVGDICKLYCVKFDCIKFDTYSNSWEITQAVPNSYSLIDFNDLLHKKTHEKKVCNEKHFIIADTLEMKNMKLLTS